VKLSDIEKSKDADLIVSFRGMPFMNRAALTGGAQLVVESGGRNCMTPGSCMEALRMVAQGLSERFPDDTDEIIRRRDLEILLVKATAEALAGKIRDAGICGKAVIASSVQKEPLQWMGFPIAGEYGRPEAMSARKVVRLSKTGRNLNAVAVVDTIQSGADAGKGIADTLGVPRVVLTNFPSEGGYLATLEANVAAVLSAVGGK
jgi:hypothetical protein